MAPRLSSSRCAKCAAGSGSSPSVAFEQRKNGLRARKPRVSPARNVVGGDRLRRESRDVGAAGESKMHFGGAASDLPHALQHRGGFRRIGERFSRGQALLLDQAVEPVGGHAPGIALVLDEGMHNRERAAIIALDQFDRAEQARRILEMGDVGEEAADLDFRMDAGGDPAQHLDDVLVVDDRCLSWTARARPAMTFLISGSGSAANAAVGRNSIWPAPTSPMVSLAWILAISAEMNSGSAVASSSAPSRGPRRTAASTLAGPLSIAV